MYVCMQAYVCMYVRKYVCMYAGLCMDVRTYVRVCMYVCMCVCGTRINAGQACHYLVPNVLGVLSCLLSKEKDSVLSLTYGLKF
jgi:hypothetical protein